MYDLLASLNRIDQKLEQLQKLGYKRQQQEMACRDSGQKLLADLQRVIDDAPKALAEVL